jgi:3-oxoacyl-[acyl-carrier-protein] synthase-3
MLYLHGLGHFYPENVITNRFLSELDIGSSEEWILERVGIVTRHTVLPLEYIRTTKNREPREALEASLYGNAQTAAAAARMAIERAGIRKEDIGLLICGSSAPDYASPAEASRVAAELGIEVPCFDMNSACTSFGVQIHFLSMTIPGALPPYILTVIPENLTRSVDYSDRRSACLFGDGSAAAVLSLTVPSRMKLAGTHFCAKPSAWDKVGIPRMGYFHQDGHAVQGFAIRKTTEALRTLLAAYPSENGHLKFVGHQANLGMLEMVCERCGIDRGNHWHNVVEYGNTASAGAPGALSLHWEEIQPGDHIALVQVGAGLSWAQMMLIVEGGR